MPRQLPTDITFDDLEDEIHFTIAAIGADPDAADLATLTTGWLPRLDEARAFDRGVRAEVARTDATRKVANTRLDRACTAFGRQLEFDLDKAVDQPRWRKFFDLPITLFVRRGFAEQTARVRAWLSTTDPVLEVHRAELDRWSSSAEQALSDTRALSTRRGENWQRREELVSDLTRERDALRDALAARARDRGLERSWPDVFFKVKERRRSEADEGSED